MTMATNDNTFTDYVVGLDLAQTVDYSALAVIERKYREATFDEAAKVTHAVRLLHRWPHGTSFPTIVADVSNLLAAPPLEYADLVVDRTGVGAAVVDLFKAEIDEGRLKQVHVTAGHEVTYENGFYRVPKKELVSVLQALLQTRSLTVARDMPLAEVLSKEFLNFRVKITIAGNETFEAWRERDHDDLVFAVAFAAWRSMQTAFDLPDLPKAGPMPNRY